MIHVHKPLTNLIPFASSGDYADPANPSCVAHVRTAPISYIYWGDDHHHLDSYVAAHPTAWRSLIQSFESQVANGVHLYPDSVFGLQSTDDIQLLMMTEEMKAAYTPPRRDTFHIILASTALPGTPLDEPIMYTVRVRGAGLGWE